jgi:Spy/CpxP family protein refolding chaperone
MRRNILIGMVAVAVVATTAAVSVGAQADGPRRGGPGPGRVGDGARITDSDRPGRSGPEQLGRGLNRPGRDMLRGRLAAALDLTDQQKTGIAFIRARTREEAAPILKELRDLRRSVMESRRAGTVTEDAARTLRTKMTTLRDQLAGVRSKTRAAVMNELTDEQRGKLQTARARVENRPVGRAPGRGPGVGGRGPLLDRAPRGSSPRGFGFGRV